MPDIVDDAQINESMALRSAIYAALTPSNYPGPLWQNGQALCRECGEPIPEKRLQAVPGVGLCLPCAKEAQKEEC